MGTFPIVYTNCALTVRAQVLNVKSTVTIPSYAHSYFERIQPTYEPPQKKLKQDLADQIHDERMRSQRVSVNNLHKLLYDNRQHFHIEIVGTLVS